MPLSRIIPCPRCKASQRADTILCTTCGCGVHGEAPVRAAITDTGLRLELELPETMRGIFVAGDGIGNAPSARDLASDTKTFLRRERMRHRAYPGMEVEPWP